MEIRLSFRLSVLFSFSALARKSPSIIRVNQILGDFNAGIAVCVHTGVRFTLPGQ